MTATAEVKQIKERPIIFSGPMVKAILEGRKTQTRRVIKPQPLDSWMREPITDWSEYYKPTRFGLKKHLWIAHPTENQEIVCPKGDPGDRLWVKEAIYYSLEHTNFYYSADSQGVGNDRFVRFMESRPDWTSHYRVNPKLNPRFMFRWASRVTLTITNIRVQRLQDISRADAIAEGVDPFIGKDATAWRAGFQLGWNEINGKGAWESNPWVWVIEFRKL